MTDWLECVTLYEYLFFLLLNYPRKKKFITVKALFFGIFISLYFSILFRTYAPKTSFNYVLFPRNQCPIRHFMHHFHAAERNRAETKAADTTNRTLQLVMAFHTIQSSAATRTAHHPQIYIIIHLPPLSCVAKI